MSTQPKAQGQGQAQAQAQGSVQTPAARRAKVVPYMKNQFAGCDRLATVDLDGKRLG
jgi:hypothetical protein